MAIGIIEFLNKQNGVPRSLEQLQMFRSESQYMCEYLIRALGSFHCGCSRINFWYTDGDLDPKIHEYFRIIDMDVPFDFRYCSMSPDEKKEYMLLGLRKIEGVSIQEFKNKFVENPTIHGDNSVTT